MSDIKIRVQENNDRLLKYGICNSNGNWITNPKLIILVSLVYI